MNDVAEEEEGRRVLALDASETRRTYKYSSGYGIPSVTSQTSYRTKGGVKLRNEGGESEFRQRSELDATRLSVFQKRFKLTISPSALDLNQRTRYWERAGPYVLTRDLQVREAKRMSGRALRRRGGKRERRRGQLAFHSRTFNKEKGSNAASASTFSTTYGTASRGERSRDPPTSKTLPPAFSSRATYPFSSSGSQYPSHRLSTIRFVRRSAWRIKSSKGRRLKRERRKERWRDQLLDSDFGSEEMRSVR